MQYWLDQRLNMRESVRWDAEQTKWERKENSGSILETYEEEAIEEHVSTLTAVKPRKVGTEEIEFYNKEIICDIW